MDKLSILMVEDNQGDVFLVREYLAEQQNAAYDLAVAETLASALDQLARRDFDVVLLDLSLPDSLGLDTVRRVITKFPGTALIVLTGLQDEEVARQAVRYGAQDYLEKQHLSPAMLNKSISYSMERKKSVQEKEDLLHDLTQALKKIESLEGILPICLSCKKILDGDGSWRSLEEYAGSRFKAEVVQLVCPSCRRELDHGESG
ncbi:MAG: response regulator [Desulfobulbaceae bacterium]|jgi:DNA-binding NtrC family response regulator|nr:response regulator [Desulfobulbaceae bacterium]MDY0352194.1 response regulator [Desulfobulbaceae bacterium]